MLLHTLLHHVRRACEKSGAGFNLDCHAETVDELQALERRLLAIEDRLTAIEPPPMTVTPGASDGFTPGPWRVGNTYGAVITDVNHPGVWTDDDNRVGYGGNLVCESVRSAANARVIAGAPTAYQLIREAIELVDDFSHTEVDLKGWLKSARQYLADVDGTP